MCIVGIDKRQADPSAISGVFYFFVNNIFNILMYKDVWMIDFDEALTVLKLPIPIWLGYTNS